MKSNQYLILYEIIKKESGTITELYAILTLMGRNRRNVSMALNDIITLQLIIVSGDNWHLNRSSMLWVAIKKRIKGEFQ